MNKKVGNGVVVNDGGTEKTMKVSGIYQDITNGGKTAKADTSLGLNEYAVLWHIVSMDVAPGVDISDKMDYYWNGNSINDCCSDHCIIPYDVIVKRYVPD